MAKFDSYGGNFAPLGYMRINEGGSHDENPNGGVQVGTDPQGVPNLLEEDETVYNDYVYSDNIYIDGGMLEKYKLPKNLNGKLYSEAADQFANEIEGMENDPIALRGFNANMVRLMNAQEEQKQIQQQKELEEELAKMSPEEIAELESQLMQMQAAEQQQAVPQEQMAVDPTMMSQQEAMAQQEIPIEQAATMQAPAQMPMMAMGGHLYDGLTEETGIIRHGGPWAHQPIGGGSRGEIVNTFTPFRQYGYRIYDNRPHTSGYGTGTFLRTADSQPWDITKAATYPSSGSWQTGTGFGLLPSGETYRDYVTRNDSGVVNDLAYDTADEIMYGPYAIPEIVVKPNDSTTEMMYGPYGIDEVIVKPKTAGSGQPAPDANASTPDTVTGAKSSSKSRDVVADQPTASPLPIPAGINIGIPGIGSYYASDQWRKDHPFIDMVRAKPSIDAIRDFRVKETGLIGDNPINNIPPASDINSDDLEVALGASGPGNLTTLPRYAGIVGNSIFALQNALTKPTRFSMPHTPPVLPVGRLDLQPEVYNPVDMNYLQNQYAAQTAGLQRGLRNSGLGPSVGANMIAGHHTGTQNLGSALLQGWDANNQRRNSTITANNSNAKQKADFDYTLDATRAQILNNYRRLMDTDWLQLQQLNDAAETQKYQALSNQLGNVFQGLAGVGQENFAMNQLNTNPALYYRVNPDGTMSYDPRWGLLYGARGVRKEGEEKSCGGFIKPYKG